MRKFSLTESTNPALKHDELFAPISGAETASVQGVINKTAMLTVIALIGGVIASPCSRASPPAATWP